MRCEKCEHDNVSDATTCTWCGSPLVPTVDSTAIPFRDLGQLINQIISIYSKSFWKFLIIALPMQLIGVVWLLLLPEAPFEFTSEASPVENEVLDDYFATMMKVAIPASLVMGLAFLISAGATTDAVVKRYLGQEINILASYRKAISKVWILIATVLLTSVVLMVGYLLAVVPFMLAALVGAPWLFAIGFLAFIFVAFPVAIFLYISFAFIIQMVIIQGTGPASALRASFSLVKGSRWRILGLGFVFYLILVGLQIPVFIAVWVIGIFSQPLAVVVYGIGGAVLAPIAFIALTVVYFDLRARKEGLTLDSLAQELGYSRD
jgi:hypothetical protein